MIQPFQIYKLLTKDVEKIALAPNEPHAHKYEELIICAEGNAEHFIDFHSNLLQAPFISFVSSGKIHRVKPAATNGQCDIWVIRFKSEFIPETTFQLYSYYHDHADLQVKRDPFFSRMVAIAEMMFYESQQKQTDYAVIRHLLSALFTMIESERKKATPGETDLNKTQNNTFKNFLSVLEENFRKSEGVEFYADKLFMTVRNLNLICQNIFQKSVSEIIELRKLTEAKNLLINTDKSVSEIGFELGYSEKTYFTSVFKKKSGQTPTDFRKEMRKLIS